ncbi:MAG: hypothetical protein ACI8S6_001076 [Myxococcota bacterium]|jgi:hypothetical protein
MLSLAMMLAACSHSPEVTSVAPVRFSEHRFTALDGTQIAVPGPRPVLVEVIRSADW